jgi:hypothetical protein
MGKSTVIQMLAEMAKGKKQLFQGMAVNQPNSPFEIGKMELSVIQLDFQCQMYNVSKFTLKLQRI